MADLDLDVSLISRSMIRKIDRNEFSSFNTIENRSSGGTFSESIIDYPSADLFYFNRSFFDNKPDQYHDPMNTIKIRKIETVVDIYDRIPPVPPPCGCGVGGVCGLPKMKDASGVLRLKPDFLR